ncbi:rod shape-determining protein MreD [Thalassococcus lentus]|uniref:Rod shape-determining protein MreD n=1 Tax=Thalassococcus lentus TaxID=1210524 RepID=A0ABT4XW73_9RHOB|nr:rod shape-determining protein MreD [Thalassococcus lentus]MDA7426196.1 rod shape-determining protein MreD [Thalassococcus lentus]
MAERTATRLWGMRAAYLGLTLLILFSLLLPLSLVPNRIAPPDVLVALTFAWALRRPDFVPALSIAAAVLLADLLLGRPPGLWAVLVLLAAEWLKSQDRRLRENTFFAEWLTVAVALMAITILYRLVLGVLIVERGTLFLMTMQFALTVMVYPIVTALSALLFGVRKSAPGEYDPVGRSL